MDEQGESRSLLSQNEDSTFISSPSPLVVIKAICWTDVSIGNTIVLESFPSLYFETAAEVETKDTMLGESNEQDEHNVS